MSSITITNTQQARAWNGYEGVHWATHQDRWDAVNSGANEYLFGAAEIGEDEDVLDVGCGNGKTSRLAALRATRERVLGIDLSQPMLERARTSAADQGLANVRFERADAQVYPFAPSSFDVAISRFGVMFFTDPVAAFANVRHALRPGGRLAFVSMGDLRTSDLKAVFAALARHVPVSTPAVSDGQGPFSLADPLRIRTVLTEAGFDDVRATPIQIDMLFGRDATDAAAFLVGSGPVHSTLEHANQLGNPQVLEAVTDALRRFEQSDGIHLHGEHWLVRAVCPKRTSLPEGK